jgi:hypothetical protein
MRTSIGQPNNSHHGFGEGVSFIDCTVRLDSTLVFSMRMVWLIEGNEGPSAVPTPSAAKTRPPSSDTLTRGPSSMVGVLLPDGREVLEDGADKRSEKGDCERDRGVLVFGWPLEATLRRCCSFFWCWGNNEAGKERPHGLQ